MAGNSKAPGDTRTDYQKGRDAIDYFTREIKEHEAKKGNNISGEEAARRAKEIAERAEKRVEKK